MMKAEEFARRLIDCAKNYKTLYIKGCFGAPLSEKNKKRYSTNYDYNKRSDRAAMIMAADEDTFGFDCVCLLKGILWGWCGDKTKEYGGAVYKKDGVPDIGTSEILKACTVTSTDFGNIEIGELVWSEGHVGAYVGDGLVVECSPKWANGVQITACNRNVSGYNRRNWTKHGKLPWIDYSEGEQTEKPASKYGSFTAPEKSCSVMLPTLRKGNGCRAVVVLQTLLGVEADGQFGPITETAVKNYQAAKRLEVDGIAGKYTWSALLTAE